MVPNILLSQAKYCIFDLRSIIRTHCCLYKLSVKLKNISTNIFCHFLAVLSHCALCYCDFPSLVQFRYKTDLSNLICVHSVVIGIVTIHLKRSRLITYVYWKSKMVLIHMYVYLNHIDVCSIAECL